jgi:hypothetical protein
VEDIEHGDTIGADAARGLGEHAVSGRSNIAQYRIDAPARGRQVIAHVRELRRTATNDSQSVILEKITRSTRGASPKRSPRYAFDHDDDELVIGQATEGHDPEERW